MLCYKLLIDTVSIMFIKAISIAIMLSFDFILGLPDLGRVLFPVTLVGKSLSPEVGHA